MTELTHIWVRLKGSDGERLRHYQLQYGFTNYQNMHGCLRLSIAEFLEIFGGAHTTFHGTVCSEPLSEVHEHPQYLTPVMVQQAAE